MKRNFTSSDLALWAALPMAQTSKIESRLTRILDRTRRRSLPRRALVLGAIIGAAALVPLAMLRPTVKVQAAFAAPQPVQLVGIVDAVTPNGNEWGADGNALPAPVFSSYWGPDTKITTQPGQKALFFVFRLSKSLQQNQVLYDVSGTTYDGFSMTRMGSSPHHPMALTTTTMQSIQMQMSGDKAVYGAAFPAALARTSIRVGTPSGPWVKEAVLSYRSNQYLNSAVVLDTYRHLKIDTTHRSKILLSLPTKNTSDFYNFRAIAVGTHGQETMLLGVEVTGFSSREEVTVSVPHTHSPFQSIRIESRAFAWQEFKNVALQPVR